jgi:type II secretory pathway pseudopilin PulG
MNHLKRNFGFSMIEMLVSTVLIVGVSAVSYRVLESQTSKQVSAIEATKGSSSIQFALNRFKLDVSMIEPNWTRYGVHSIYAHQGYGLGGNYHQIDVSYASENNSLMDGVTFLRRNPNSDRLYVPDTSFAENLCFNKTLSTSDQNIFDDLIAMDSVEGIEVGDWMLAYQAGSYMLGIVKTVGKKEQNSEPLEAQDRSISGPGNSITGNLQENGENDDQDNAILLRAPNSAESALFDSKNYVLKPGVVWASINAPKTAKEKKTSNNSICFETSKMNFQKMASPVSYYSEYQTSDGQAKSNTNAYVLDEKGNKIKMLVRSEYVGGLEQREYLAKIEDLGFTYDIMDGDSVSSIGGILRNIGRNMDAEGLIGVVEPAILATNHFYQSNRILAIRMSVSVATLNPDNPGEIWKQNREVKVALDPSLQQGMYDSESTVISSLTETLETLPHAQATSAVSENIGKPLYLVHGNGSEMLVPVSALELSNEGTMGLASEGGIYVYDDKGCAVNPEGSCSPSESSVVRFLTGSESKFFPSSVVEVKLPDGGRRIIAGGMALQNTLVDNVNGVVRQPGIGVITLNEGQTLAEKIAEGPGADQSCSIGGCSFSMVNTDNAELVNLMDTANISVNPSNPDQIWVAPMTKKIGKNSMSSVYKGTWSGSNYEFTKFADLNGSEDGKVVTALSDKMFRIGDDDYLAACLTKSMDSGCPNGECLPLVPASPTLYTGGIGAGVQVAQMGLDETTVDPAYGEIRLIRYGSGMDEGNNGIPLIRHNYRCSAIVVDNQNNLIVSGRLTIQSIDYQTIKAAIQNGGSALQNNILFLDEVVSSKNRTNAYADYYQVDPSTYENATEPQYIGWLTGMSAVEFSDGTFGMLTGNKMRLEANYKQNTTDSIKEFSNAGISEVKLAGVSERVVATIETDPSNINNSVITATYVAQTNTLPSVYIPGSFLVRSGTPRTTPTPLPAMDVAVSESQWLQLYVSLLSPQGGSSELNSGMPVLGGSMETITECNASLPSTCN